MGLITETEKYGLNRMTKKAIVNSCKKNKLYITPNLNDVLYLHFQGYQKIEDLEEYTGLKCLWLESNAITEISGLENQKLLKCLFLHNNLITKIENLDGCRELDTLNLSFNQVNRIDNCGSDILPVLNTLNLGNNYLRTAESIESLRTCLYLSVLDLSNNRIDDILVVKIFADMPELKVLILAGNPVVNEIPSYRKTLIVECKKLTYLDARPVFPRDRACAEAWKRGGYQEERQENIRWNKQERREMLRSVNATLRVRNRGGGEPEVQLIPTDSSDDDEYYSREIRPKQCEDVSSNEQWNIMDEMLRNPEDSDKFQSCKVCGSAYCKFQHIEALKTVKEVEMSTEEILESSNFARLWGDQNLEACNGDNNNGSLWDEVANEITEGASCSETNKQRTEENGCIVISGENLEDLNNIPELVKISLFPEGCDSDDDSMVNTPSDIVCKLVDDFELSVENNEPQYIEEVRKPQAKETNTSGQSHVIHAAINVTEYLETGEILSKCSEVLDNSNYSIVDTADIVCKLVDGLDLSVEYSEPDQCNVDHATISNLCPNLEITENLTKTDVVELVEDNKIDTSNENIETNVDSSIECCKQAEEKDSAVTYAIEYETPNSIQDTFKSTDLSTLWEENSLVDLDDNDEVKNIEKYAISLVEEPKTTEEYPSIALCTINIEEATCSYKVNSDEETKPDDSNFVAPIEGANINHALIETLETENSETLLSFECSMVPMVESADECITDNLKISVESKEPTRFANSIPKKLKSIRTASQQNQFLISRIKKNCVELNHMMESKPEHIQPANVIPITDEPDEPEVFEDVDNSSTIETLGYSTFVASFEQFFNEHEVKSAELLKTIDFSSLYTPEKNIPTDDIKEEEKPSASVDDTVNVDEIPVMKNFREYRAHVKSLLHRDCELRDTCNELLNEISDQLEAMQGIDQLPAADNEASPELDMNTNNALLTNSNSFYKICYDDPNSSLEYASIGNEIEENQSSPNVYLDAIEQTEDDESHDI